VPCCTASALAELCAGANWMEPAAQFGRVAAGRYSVYTGGEFRPKVTS